MTSNEYSEVSIGGVSADKRFPATIRLNRIPPAFVTGTTQKRWSRFFFVVSPTMRSSLLLHLRLEDMAHTALQVVADPLIVFTEVGPVIVIEVLDDLEGPPSLDDVSPDHLGFEPIGMLVVACISECFDGLTQ
jgi:hypothetical protein